VEATKQKEEKRKKTKPEEQEGMPQRQHCPPGCSNQIFLLQERAVETTKQIEEMRKKQSPRNRKA
jgi:hypothetical protein